MNGNPFSPRDEGDVVAPDQRLLLHLRRNDDASRILLTALVEANGIPANAPTSITLEAPPIKQGFGEAVEEEGVSFHKALLPDGKESVATVAGVGSEAYGYFRWISMQGGSLEAGDGTYRDVIATKVGGRTLEAHASIKIEC